MENLSGIYGFLYNCPTWAIALGLEFFCIGILFIMRDWYEKLPYNISVASQQGDHGIIGLVLIGVEVLKRQKHLPDWARNIVFDMPAIAVIILLAGSFYHWLVTHSKLNDSQTIADTYHNKVIVPLFVILIGILAPIIWMYGTGFEQVAAILLVLVWPATMIFDVKQGRLQQTKWLLERGLPRFYGKSGYRVEAKPLVEGTPIKY